MKVARKALFECVLNSMKVVWPASLLIPTMESSTFKTKFAL